MARGDGHTKGHINEQQQGQRTNNDQVAGSEDWPERWAQECVKELPHEWAKAWWRNGHRDARDILVPGD